MAIVEGQTSGPVAAARRVPWARWGLVALVGVLLWGLDVLSVVYFGIDAREQFLLDAWQELCAAGAVWLLIPGRSWIKHAFAAILFISSIDSLTQGVGIWHSVCVEHTETSGPATMSYSYCLPSWGPSPEFD